MLLSMGSSDKSGSNKDGSSVFDHFVVSGLFNKVQAKDWGREGKRVAFNENS